MSDCSNVGTPEATLRVMLDRLATEDLYCVDVETSGLDFRKNFICGYVLAFSPDPLDSYYLPVRHAGSANLGGVTGPRNATAWDETITEGERELVKALDHKGALVFGHNLGFDLRFLARTGAFHFKPQCEDTIINAALLDEYQRSYSLEDCAKIAGVQAKKSEEIVKYLCERFPEAAKNPKQAMGHFWRLEGGDPMAHEYARGDGTTTWQLRDWQNKQIVEQELEKVHRVESRLIRILARMSFRGIKVDENRLAEVIKLVDDEISGLMAKLPEGFNPKSPLQMIKYCTEHGQTDWPYTAPSPRFPKGQPSFPEAWLITHEPGQRIVEVRKLETLKNSFLIPLRDEHVWRGRVHATFNQLRGDEYGTITGRLSCSMPNLQQIHKRNKKLGKLIRSIFVPDDGLIWASADFRQCEPVLLAYYSRSKVLLAGYRSVPQIDGHQAVADATGLDRDSGKRCNQLIITGGGPAAMSRKFGVPLGRARQIFAEFFKKMPEVKRLQQRASATFASRGYVVSLLGRRARLESRDKDYTAINRLLQCGNADIIKSKMVQIDDYLESIDSPVWMLNNIHDDLSFQFDEDHRPHYEQCLHIMEDFGPGQPIELDVPLGVDPGEGSNWAIATYGADK